MGHGIGEEKRAYLNLPTEELRDLYMDAEKHLAIEKTSRDELAERKGKVLKLSNEYEKRIVKLETTIDVLSTQNTVLNERVSLATQRLKNVEGIIKQMRELTKSETS